MYLSEKNNEIKDFRRFFRSLHNIIRDSEKLDRGSAFDELSKLLFLKIAIDESKNNKKPLSIEKIEEWEKLLRTYSQIFPDIFREEEKINLKIPTIKTLLIKMENFSLKDGKIDIKGRAFEEFLPSQLRGKGLGQFFTPRLVVDFMVELADISIYDTVLDFSCGSAGFLIKAFDEINKLANNLPDGIIKQNLIEKIKNHQIYGIDAEPRAVRIAKINMLMWGDAKNIIRGNGLDTKDYLGKSYILKEYDKNIENTGCSLILANPPFGSSEKEKNIIANYDLGKGKNSQKTELLFIEKGYKYLKPQGKMLIVLPEGVISNPSDKYVRDFILKHFEIKAVISLPTHTFVQSGVDTIKTVILYLEKNTNEKQEKINELLKTNEKIEYIIKQNFNYNIFMGKANYIGYEPNGRIIKKKDEKTDLNIILEDYKEQVKLKDIKEETLKIEKDIEEIKWKRKDLKESFLINFNEIEDRLDIDFYIFKKKYYHILKKYNSLESSIVIQNNLVRPLTDEEMDIEYKLLAITNKGVEFNKFIKGEEFKKYKQVFEGDIVYNPYRINVGSIDVINKEYDGGLVSPAYIIFRLVEINPYFFVNMLKTPFYKMYIDILTTGSIRNNFNEDLLKTIKFPNLKIKQQETINKQINKSNEDIIQFKIKKDKLEKNKIKNLYSLLDNEKLILL